MRPWRLLCRRALHENSDAPRLEAENRIRGLDAQELRWLLQAFSAFFHLINQAEKREILRINRERSRGMDRDGARAESIDDAIAQLRAGGHDADAVQELLRNLDIQPTLTAHPTEARRRSVLDKQQRIAELLTRLRRQPTPDEMEDALDGIYAQITLLLTTGEVRVERPTVRDEVDRSVFVMSPEYGSRLQLQKIAMLDLADVVVVNKNDRAGAKTAKTEIEFRVGMNPARRRVQGQQPTEAYPCLISGLTGTSWSAM